jgi:hypothetical protein
MKFTCDQCGKEFSRAPNKRRPRTFCSRQCFWEHMRGKRKKK